MDIKLRKIKKSDWPQMKNILSEYNDYHKKIFSKTDPAFAVFAQGYEEKYFYKMVNKKKKIFLAALDNEKIVGFINAKVYDNKLDNKKVGMGYLTDIFVTKNHRGKGVAELMWQEVLKWFKHQGVKFYQLHVLYDNKDPQKIYKKWGFKPFGLRMMRKL